MLDEMDEDDASDRDTSEDVSYVDTCVRLAGMGVHVFLRIYKSRLSVSGYTKIMDNYCVSKH